MNNLMLIRVAVALVWSYEGLWCKLLGRAPHHETVIQNVPFLTAGQAHTALVILGGLECAIAVWVLCGRWQRTSAVAQTALLALMNSGGLLWASSLIPDPAGMLLQNFAFILLAWIAAGEFKPYAAHY